MHKQKFCSRISYIFNVHFSLVSWIPIKKNIYCFQGGPSRKTMYLTGIIAWNVRIIMENLTQKKKYWTYSSPLLHHDMHDQCRIRQCGCRDWQWEDFFYLHDDSWCLNLCHHFWTCNNNYSANDFGDSKIPWYSQQCERVHEATRGSQSTFRKSNGLCGFDLGND